MKLEQDGIVAAALDLMDEVGLGGLNLRAVADRLQVKAPALYWHVADKSELLALMSAYVFQSAYEAAPLDGEWRDWLAGFGRALRRSLMNHRDSAQLCALTLPHREAMVTADQMAAPLVGRGITPQAAHSYQGSVISLTLGWALYEQSDTMRPYLAGLFDFGASYELGLQALVQGFPNPEVATETLRRAG